MAHDVLQMNNLQKRMDQHLVSLSFEELKASISQTFYPKENHLGNPHFVDCVLTPLKDKNESIEPSSKPTRMRLHLDNCPVFNSPTSFQKHDE